MLTSEPCLELLSALLAARLAFPPITRNCEAWSPKSKKSYPYADLNGILDGVIPVLGAHGLLLMQAPEDGEAGLLCITTTLFHVTSGQWIRSSVSFERLANPQDAGSAITYMKRYSLAALLSISTEDDDAASLNGSSKPEPSAAAENPRPSVPVNGNGHTPDQTLTGAHPSPEQIEALFVLALETCTEDPDVFSTRIRQTMNLPAHASTAKRLLPKTMSGEQFDRLWTYYQTLLAQLQRQTEVVHAKAHKEVSPNGAEPSPQDIPASPEPQPSAGDTTPDPQPAAPEPDGAVESSVAPEPADTVDSLVAYAISLGLEEGVVKRIIKMHKDLGKCRRIFIDAAERNNRAVA